MGGKKGAAKNAIRKLIERFEGYELYQEIEKRLDLRKMRFDVYKLDPDAIDELVKAYKKLNDRHKETIFREFGEFLSVRVQVGLFPLKLDQHLLCEFLDNYIVEASHSLESIERIEILQDIYKRDGQFKAILDEYYRYLADSQSISPLEYLYVKGMITKDPEILKTAYKEYEKASGYDGLDKEVRLLLIGATLAECAEH
jgi:hypothetical protein